jgi:hypothetical protein
MLQDRDLLISRLQERQQQSRGWLTDSTPAYNQS